MLKLSNCTRALLFFGFVLLALFCSTKPCRAELLVSSTSPKQGQVLAVTVTEPAASGDAPTNEAQAGEASSQTTAEAVQFNGHSYKLFRTLDADRTKTELRALLGVPADLRPGSYRLKFGLESLPITVKDGHFPLQHLRLPPAKDNFLMSPGEEAAVEGAKATCSDNRLWHGLFVPPSTYRVSSSFGLKRSVNGKILEDYFHAGLDFAAPLGAPIVACAGGKVLLARTGYRLHGNMVAIDHGQGVVSFYIHMSKILVQEGQLVKAGEKIGAVGQSGRATGPHLHFSIYVNQVATNPRDWFAIQY